MQSLSLDFALRITEWKDTFKLTDSFSELWGTAYCELCPYFNCLLTVQMNDICHWDMQHLESDTKYTRDDDL